MKFDTYFERDGESGRATLPPAEIVQSSLCLTCNGFGEIDVMLGDPTSGGGYIRKECPSCGPNSKSRLRWMLGSFAFVFVAVTIWAVA